MALMTYFTRDKHGTYYFRRPIPARLRAFMPAPWSGKTAFKQSLRTKRPAEARSRAARLYDESERAFGQAEFLPRLLAHTLNIVSNLHRGIRNEGLRSPHRVQRTIGVDLIPAPLIAFNVSTKRKRRF